MALYLKGETSPHNSTLTHNIDEIMIIMVVIVVTSRTAMMIMMIIFFFFFLRGHGNESCNLIGS